MNEIDLETIKQTRSVNYLQYGPKNLCRTCQDMARNYVITLKAEVERLRAMVKESEDVYCEWINDEIQDEHYTTGCDNEQYFTDGNIQDNQYLFCPYCGKKIKER